MGCIIVILTFFNYLRREADSYKIAQKTEYSLFVVYYKKISTCGIGGDPGGDGGDVSPPRIFLGGIVPPSIFESLKISIHIFAF